MVTSVEISLRGSGTLADSDGSLLPRKSHGGQTIQAQDSTLACKKKLSKNTSNTEGSEEASHQPLASELNSNI